MSGSNSLDDSECRIVVTGKAWNGTRVATCLTHGGLFDPRESGLSGHCPYVQDQRRIIEQRTSELPILDEERTLVLPPRPSTRSGVVTVPPLTRLKRLLSALLCRVIRWLDTLPERM